MKRLKLVFLALGLFLLGYLVYRVGPSTLLDQLLSVGWGFAAVVAVAVASIVMMAVGWGSLLKPGGSKAAFWELSAASVVGAAINFLTPGSLGGEPLKAALLKDKVPTHELVSSVLLHNVLYWVSNLILIVAGTVTALILLALPARIAWFMAGATVGVAVPILVVAWLVHRGLAERFLKLLGRLGLKRAAGEDVLEKARKADREVRRFASENRWPFLKAFFWVFVGRALCVVEVWVILKVMSIDAGPAAVFLIQSLSLIVYIVFAFVPSQLGANEGASYFLFPYLGMSSGVGVAMEMVRRLRIVATVLLGLLILGLYSLRGAPVRPDSEPSAS